MAGWRAEAEIESGEHVWSVWESEKEKDGDMERDAYWVRDGENWETPSVSSCARLFFSLCVDLGVLEEEDIPLVAELIPVFIPSEKVTVGGDPS